MLPEDFLERLRNANPITNVMSRYVQLKHAGRLYKCLCPFHSERTPSCTVYPDTESFYCFGCGAGGDVISFVMRISNLSYIEAVKMLAEQSGIPLPEDAQHDDGITALRKRIYEANRAAANYFFHALNTQEGKIGLAYIAKRGVKPETVKKYGLGYADAKWTSLRDHLLAEGFTTKELEAASLISTGKSGNTFDFFMNRVMFPFIDLRGNIIGFGGRTLSTDDPRKYLNSRETLVFQKNKFLFSLNFAKNVAAKEKRLILCEGNLDVISLHQAGFETAVATCGTAITPEHARMMTQYAEEVVLCFDSDAAGQKATQKAIGILQETGMRTRVLVLDGAKDPDEYIQKFGAARFRNLLEKSDGAVEFELKRCAEGLDLENDTNRIEYLNRMFAVIAQIPGRVNREVYISRIAREAGIPRDAVESSVLALLRKQNAGNKKKQWRAAENFQTSTATIKAANNAADLRREKAQKGTLCYLLHNPDSAEFLRDSISPDVFSEGFYRSFYTSLQNRLQNAANISISAFGGEFSPDEMGKISEIINLNREIPVTDAVLQDYLNILTEPAAAAADEDEDLEALKEALRKKIK